MQFRYTPEVDLSKHTLEHKLVHEPLTEQITFTLNRLASAQPQSITTQLMAMMVKIADSNYSAIRTLIRTNHQYGTVSMIICRSTIELVFMTVMMLANPNKYVSMYIKAGWKEQYLELQRHKADEKTVQLAPKWLELFDKYLDFHAITTQLTPEERKKPSKIPYFPTPTQIMNRKRHDYLDDVDEPTQAFLRLLDSAYYSGLLSQISHYSESGIAWQIGPMYPDYPDEQRQLHTSQPVGIAMMIMLCLLSEISIFFHFNNRAKLRELWTYLAMHVDLYRDLYDKKYKMVL